MLGFVKRQAQAFDCPFVTKALYCALVRPLLEYASIVWDPVFDCDRKRIESIQKQFVIYSLRHLQWRNGYQLPPYDARLTLLGLDCLADRRVQAACTFVVSCASGLIKAQEFQGSFRVAHRERATRLATSETRLQLPTLSRSRYIENAQVFDDDFNRLMLC